MIDDESGYIKRTGRAVVLFAKLGFLSALRKVAGDASSADGHDFGTADRLNRGMPMRQSCAVITSFGSLSFGPPEAWLKMAGRLSSRRLKAAAARSGGQGRTGATRSRAQGSSPEHGEHGEDRTLTAASTVAALHP